jgi:hypothetical protein
MRKIRIKLIARYFSDRTGAMTGFYKSSRPSRLSFSSVNREASVIASSRMRNMISASSDTTFIPSIQNIKHKRGVDWNTRMQARIWMPSSVAQTSYGVIFFISKMQGKLSRVTGYNISIINQTIYLYLETL